MQWRRILAAFVIGCLGVAVPAHAADITFATLSSSSGIPSIFLDLSAFGISSIDLPTPYPASDPFSTSAPIDYTQLTPPNGPLPALFKMAPVAPTGPSAYGPGSFSIGIVGASSSIPWVTGAFTDATLSLAPDLLTGTLSNFGGTTFSGLGLDISGLGPLGSFAFALGNPFTYQDVTGAPIGLGYEITSGALAAAPVPEPTSIFLLGSGLAGLYYRRRRRA